jgi:hypothetical protein
MSYTSEESRDVFRYATNNSCPVSQLARCAPTPRTPARCSYPPRREGRFEPLHRHRRNPAILSVGQGTPYVEATLTTPTSTRMAQGQGVGRREPLHPPIVLRTFLRTSYSQRICIVAEWFGSRARRCRRRVRVSDQSMRQQRCSR